MDPLLEVKDVCLSYHSLSGETAALSHISFHLMPEEFLAVVGPSGCGKSTLLNLICGLLHAESGTILMNGKLLNKDSARIGYMLQKDHLLEWRSIYRNVLLGLEIQGELTKDNLSYVDEMLKLYELDKFRDSRPSQLSGGMRRRVQDLGLVPGTRVTCVRRALSGDPIAYRIRGAVVALRKCDAAQIEVQP